MASPTTVLLISVIAAALATSATARPCKTIFFITSTNHPHLPNPNNLPIQNPNNPPRFTFFITEIHQFHQFKSSSNDVVFPKPYASSSSSNTDRTMDILSIIGALLFGAGCGALTAATMYLIWSLCSNRRLDFVTDSDSDDVASDDDVSPNKNGYVAVPTGVKEVPPTADEVDAMK